MPTEEALQLLDATFPGPEEAILVHAPGRTNLIGEHTDYNEGFVFPAAIAQGVSVAARPNGTNTVRLVSAQAGPAEAPLDSPPKTIGSWAKYPLGVAWALGARTGLDAAVVSDLPMASGVSSSAALEMAFAVLWNELENLGHDNKQLALLAQRAENQFVGVNCGIMDQMASAMGREGQAFLLDTLTLEITYAPLPPGLSIVVCDTGKPRTLADSAYNDRRATCEAAAKALGIPSLRTATLDQVEALPDPLQQKRARHVVTENQRCLDFHKALQSQDLPTVARLMAASHASLRDDYEVSCPELDAMVEAALESPGCLAARMTGAGFGGCAVALVETDVQQAFISACEQNYVKRVKPYKPAILGTTAAEGAHRVR